MRQPLALTFCPTYSAPMPRTGRPPSDNPRATLLTLRLTAAEHARLTAAAAAAGQQLGPYVRDRALAAAKRAR
jgi:predicted HicB family RNase H-like nuclease